MEHIGVEKVYFAELLSRSLAALKSCYFKALLVLFVEVIISAISRCIPVIHIVSNLLLFPMTVGVMLFFLRSARGENAPVESIFEPYKQFWRMIWGAIRVALFIFLWALPFVAVMIFLAVFLYSNQDNGAKYVSVLAFGLMIAAALAAVPIIIAVFRYAMTYYVMLDDPDMPVKDAMKTSIQLMKGQKFRLFGYNLLLSVIWMLLISALLIVCVLIHPLLFFIGFLPWFAFLPVLSMFNASFYVSLLPAVEVLPPDADAEIQE